MLKNGFISGPFGVGGPVPKGPDMAQAVTNGRSMGGDVSPRADPLVDTDGVGTPEACRVVSSRVIVSSDGNFPALLCLRRLLDGPGNSVGDACLERLRGEQELALAPSPFGDAAKEPAPGGHGGLSRC